MGRLSCIIWVNPKFSHVHLYKRDGGDLTQQRKRRYKDGAERDLMIGVMQTQPRNARSHKKVDKERCRSSPRAFRPCQHLDFAPVLLMSDFRAPGL